jgi:hypothetical protein
MPAINSQIIRQFPILGPTIPINFLLTLVPKIRTTLSFTKAMMTPLAMMTRQFYQVIQQ